MELFKNTYTKIEILDLDLSEIEQIKYLDNFDVAVTFYDNEKTATLKWINSFELFDKLLSALEECVQGKRIANNLLESAGIIDNFCGYSIHKYGGDTHCHFAYRKYNVWAMQGYGVALYQQYDLFYLEVFDICDFYNTSNDTDDFNVENFDYWMNNVFSFKKIPIIKEDIINFYDYIKDIKSKISFFS